MATGDGRCVFDGVVVNSVAVLINEAVDPLPLAGDDQPSPIPPGHGNHRTAQIGSRQLLDDESGRNIESIFRRIDHGDLFPGRSRVSRQGFRGLPVGFIESRKFPFFAGDRIACCFPVTSRNERDFRTSVTITL